MLIGSLGVALAAKGLAPRVGLGSLVAAAFLLDLLFGLFAVLHVESAAVPADFALTHALAYSFPWSHGLVAAVFWSLAAGFVWTWSGAEGKYLAFAPAVVSATAFSHWVLDAVVLPPREMPLWGPGSATLGLGLGEPGGLYLGCALGAAGLGLFLRRKRPGAVQRAVVTGMVLIAAMLSAADALRTTPPADVKTATAASLVAIFGAIVVAALADRETA